jgi:hypothetical protein
MRLLTSAFLVFAWYFHYSSPTQQKNRRLIMMNLKTFLVGLVWFSKLISHSSGTPDDSTYCLEILYQNSEL